MPNLSFLGFIAKISAGFFTVLACDARAQDKPTHCLIDEATFFSCRIGAGATVASLCGHVLDPLKLDNSDIAVIFRSGVPKGSLFKYPQHPVSIKEGKFIGHHERPYQGGYSSDEVSFYVGGVSHGVYVIDENGVISGSVAGKGPRASLCAPGSITNSLWQLIISLPDPAKK